MRRDELEAKDEWRPIDRLCHKCSSDDVEYRVVEALDGAHDDIQYRCNTCGCRWWLDGDDGFTLIELLVVILIIGIITVLAIPTIVPAISHRQVSEAARILQGAIVGARDSAIHNNAPSGIRLLPDPQFTGIGPPAYTVNGVATANPFSGIIDPAQPLAASRIVPLEQPPSYSEGKLTQWNGPFNPMIAALPYPGPGTLAIPNPTYGQTSCLMVAEAVVDSVTFLPNSPTSWFWNVRVGDRIQINNAGPWYTVIGPMTQGPAQGNTEMFVNVGPPGTPFPWAGNASTVAAQSAEFLLLVNGKDDNGNGWTDEGWDGVDNNFNQVVDEVEEWEVERWSGTLATQQAINQPYTITRRPAPSTNAREVALPTQVVIDMTTVGTTQERSRLPFNAFTGYVDILVYPNGQVVPTTIYSSPSSIGMGGAFLQFWLAERSDVLPPVGTVAPTMPIGVLNPANVVPYSGPYLKGQYWLVTLSARTGQIVSTESPAFDNPAHPANGPYNPSVPFYASMQGVR